MKQFNFLTGRSTDSLEFFLGNRFLVHREVREPLETLFHDAESAGINLALSSSFRSYEDQAVIWNKKASGLLPVLDSDSVALDISNYSNEELLFKILRWSAIPGGSRHHWGTDFDVYDKNGIPPDYKVQLIPQEYEEGGPFYNANNWLSENMERYGFFRPYLKDSGGVAPEPWHISYSPISEKCSEEYSIDLFIRHLDESNFLLRDEAKQYTTEIFQRFMKRS